MGNLLPSLGRRALPILEMPKLGGKVSGAPIGSTAWFAKDPGAAFAEANGQAVKITDPSFPFTLLADGAAVQIPSDTRLAPYRNNFNDLVYAKGRYIAAAYDQSNIGGIMTSPDMNSWQWLTDYVNSNPSNIPQCVAFGNDRFVMSSSNAGIRTSTDGVTWTPAAQLSAQSYNVNMLRFVNGRFVAFCYYSSNASWTVWTSTDGLSWQMVGTLVSSNGNIWSFTDIVWTGVQYVVSAGATPSGQEQYARVWTSTDLVTWVTRFGGGTLSYPMRSTASIGPRVLAASEKVYAYSADHGVNWTQPAQLFTDWNGYQYVDVIGVAATPEYFIAWDRSNVFYTSPDGATWTRYGATPSIGNLRTRSNIGPAGSILMASSYPVTNGGGGTDYYGVAMRASAGKNMFALPVVPSQSLKALGSAKAYMRIAA